MPLNTFHSTVSEGSLGKQGKKQFKNLSLPPWQHEASVVLDVKRFGPLALLQLLEVIEEGPVVRTFYIKNNGGSVLPRGETNF